MREEVEVEVWRSSQIASIEEFEAGLRAHGFEPDGDDGWLGDIPEAAAAQVPPRHRIVLAPNHPFAPPWVHPQPVPSEPHWHLESNGRLCLYSQAQRAGLPWTNLDELFAKVITWHQEDAAGWPNDEGDLDLERYFPDNDSTLIVFEDIDRLLGRRLHVEEHRGYSIVTRGPSVTSTNNSVARRERRDRSRGIPWAIGIDLGHLDRPTVTWLEIRDRIPGDVIARLRAEEDLDKEGILLARYSRGTPTGERAGAVAIRVPPAQLGHPRALVALRCEDRGAAIRNRQGLDVDTVTDRHIAIVGVGAVGSFLADLLVRSGLGTLTMVDGDVMRIGNSVRHLLHPDYANTNKARAVASHLRTTRAHPGQVIEGVGQSLDPELLWRLLAECDLVVDATAAPDVHEMFEHFATVAGLNWVEAALYRAGAVARVDRLGAGTAAATDRPPRVDALPGDEGVRETGCGDPVSPSSPVAVAAAAALAARMTIDTLRPRRQRLLPDSLVEVLTPSSADRATRDDRYLNIGTVTSP